MCLPSCRGLVSSSSMPGTPSVRGREVQRPGVSCRGLRCRPPAGDRLAAGVETEPPGAGDVGGAEEGAPPAAEGVEGQRRRGRVVDAVHAYFGLALEAARLVAGAGEDRGAV